jgi:hypothetical protein
MAAQLLLYTAHVRVIFRAVLAAVLTYVIVVAGLAIAMRQPPDTFGAIMARMPSVAFMVFPFETLWMSARAGHLKPGDSAPDFVLKTVDGSAQVTLSSFRGQRPVVLIFGSYT